MKKVVFAFAVMMCSSAWAQNDTPARPDQRQFFRFDFVLKENENGKLTSSRSFKMMMPADDQPMSSIRSGDKISVAVGGGATTYIDVGVNLDVRRIHRRNDDLTFEIVAEASSAEAGTKVIHQVKWNSIVQIGMGKPVVIFSSDGPAAQRQVQLEVTATPIQ